MRQQGMSPEGMDMQTSQHSPGDPFIGNNGGTFPTGPGSDTNSNTLHSKQESADSGLGGMGNTFSLARGTGEEFMEESMEDGKLFSEGDWVVTFLQHRFVVSFGCYFVMRLGSFAL